MMLGQSRVTCGGSVIIFELLLIISVPMPYPFGGKRKFVGRALPIKKERWSVPRY